MRCPNCGYDADPANALCPSCHSALHIAAAPSSPYANSQPQYQQPQYQQPAPQWTEQDYPQGQYPQGQYPQGQHYTVQGPAGAPPDAAWPSGNYQILEPGAPPERGRTPWVWLVVVIAVLLVGAGAAVAVVKLVARHPNISIPHPGSSSPTPVVPTTKASSANADAGRNQAIAVDQLLTASSASRQKLGPALDQVDACGDVNGALAILQQVTTERDDQVKSGQGLAVDQLTNGTQMRAALVQALTFSLTADQKYTAWAQAVAAGGCSGHATHDGNYAAAQAASGSATTSKQAFVGLWNPIAGAYNLPTRSESTV